VTPGAVTGTFSIPAVSVVISTASPFGTIEVTIVPYGSITADALPTATFYALVYDHARQAGGIYPATILQGDVQGYGAIIASSNPSE
jgi:hypothetical protein